MDLSWSLALAALVAVEAIREVPSGATHVLWRVPWGPWRVSELRVRFGRMWAWPCLLGGDVVVAGTASGTGEVQGRASETINRTPPPWLVRTPNLVAVLTSAMIVVALPAVAHRAGLPGLLLGACFTLNLWLVTCLVTFVVDRLEHAPSLGRPGVRIRLCSPFAVLTLAGSRVERSVSGRSAADVIRDRLSPVALQGFVRTTWYDLRESSAGDQAALPAAVLASMAAEERDRLLSRAPADAAAGERYCPRCGAVFQATVAACSDCRGAPALLLA